MLYKILSLISIESYATSADHRSDDSPYLVTGIRPLSTLYIYEEIFQHKLEKWNAKEAKQAADCYCVHDYV